MTKNTRSAALREIDAAEANLVKAENLMRKISAAIPLPDGALVTDDPEYEDNCRSFHAIWDALQKIDGWKPEIAFPSLIEIVQSWQSIQDHGGIGDMIAMKHDLEEPERLLREYRFRFNQMRRAIVRRELVKQMGGVDVCLQELAKEIESSSGMDAPVKNPLFEELKDHVAQIDGLIDDLLGDSAFRPERWTDLRRHLHFGVVQDLHDIIHHDWPEVKSGLRESMYDDGEPVPSGVEDLSSLLEQAGETDVSTPGATPENFQHQESGLINRTRASLNKLEETAEKIREYRDEAVIGHNNPPESISETPYSRDDEENLFKSTKRIGEIVDSGDVKEESIAEPRDALLAIRNKISRWFDQLTDSAVPRLRENLENRMAGVMVVLLSDLMLKIWELVRLFLGLR